MNVRWSLPVFTGNDYHLSVMTRLESLEEEIKKLSPTEFGQLRDWVLEHDWAQWDQQIEQDSANGKLDALFDEAERAHSLGTHAEYDRLTR